MRSYSPSPQSNGGTNKSGGLRAVGRRIHGGACAASAVNEETGLDGKEQSRGGLMSFDPWLTLNNNGVSLQVGMLQPKHRPSQARGNI